MMRKLSEKALQARDAKRDLNAELLESVRDLKRGIVGRVTVLRDGKTVEVPAVKVRMAAGLSQSEFAGCSGLGAHTPGVGNRGGASLPGGSGAASHRGEEPGRPAQRAIDMRIRLINGCGRSAQHHRPARHWP